MVMVERRGLGCCGLLLLAAVRKDFLGDFGGRSAALAFGESEGEGVRCGRSCTALVRPLAAAAREKAPRNSTDESSSSSSASPPCASTVVGSDAVLSQPRLVLIVPPSPGAGAESDAGTRAGTGTDSVRRIPLGTLSYLGVRGTLGKAGAPAARVFAGLLVVAVVVVVFVVTNDAFANGRTKLLSVLWPAAALAPLRVAFLALFARAASAFRSTSSTKA